MTAGIFSGPKAIARLQRIEAFIGERSTATARDIAAELDIATSTASNFIRELWLSGAIRKVNPRASGCIEIIWELGEDPAAVAAAAATMQPARRIVTSWVPNHRREPLHCFLFGVPVAMAGASA